MTTFTTTFKDELLDLLETKIGILCRNEEIEYSKGQYQIKFDGYIEKKDETIVIEIEFRRADPISNLVKTLHWACYRIQNKKVKMIQLFDENYYSAARHVFKKDLTIFLAKRCNLLHKKLTNFKYVPLSVLVEPSAFRKKNELAAKKLAKETYEKLIKIIED